MVQTIVLGYDGTDEGRRALERTERLARAFGSRIVVVCVVEVPVASTAPGAIVIAEDSQRHCEQATGEALEALAAGGLRAEVRLEVGSPAEAIISVADAEGADLIVTGRRSHGFLSRLFGGGVSESLMRHATCDVLVVH